MTNYYDNVYINNKYSLLASTKYDPIVTNNVDNCINDFYINRKQSNLLKANIKK